MTRTATFKTFEVYENGDPYSRTWDCSERVGDGPTYYRGDLSGMWPKSQLVSYLRHYYPDCEIVNRSSGRTIKDHD